MEGAAVRTSAEHGGKRASEINLSGGHKREEKNEAKFLRERGLTTQPSKKRPENFDSN